MTEIFTEHLEDYNEAVAKMHYVLDPIQNVPQYNIAPITNNSSLGLHTPPEVIDVSSFLSDRGNPLTKCIPETNYKEKIEIFGLDKNEPVPSTAAQFERTMETFMNPINSDVIETGAGNHANSDTTYDQFLLSEYTRVKGAAKDLSNVNWQAGFAGNSDNLHTSPQNLTHIIERMALERGGLNSNQLIKNTWNLATPNNPLGPLNFNKQSENPPCLKIKDMQSYPIWAEFGLRHPKTWNHFNATDVESVGISSPQYGNPNNQPFHTDAPYNNGGCNTTSMLNKDGCNNTGLTGSNNNWEIIQPQGI